ncbi:hypothetical protein N0V83_000931 [Neocucurbitaria cava]|uniref:Uncharacterized protein n=1 Tax=Neocucurbitaria cava TaxID=798079 RepID=A0A9W9CSL2_9PLEO|nr:hypothetical protein N0V83_000931 [Neocucurbitaria cava]
MGSLFAKEAPLTSVAIESMYAARAAAARKSAAAAPPTEEPSTGEIQPLKGDGQDRVPNEYDSDVDEMQPRTDECKDEYSERRDANVNGSADNSGPSPSERIAHLKVIRNIPLPISNFPTKAMEFKKAIQVFDEKVKNAVDSAVQKLKQLRVLDMAKATGKWMKEHPWETAATVIPLILLACTPAILGAVGFTAGGIAAGTLLILSTFIKDKADTPIGSIAAGIQASIGSVAAGSAFAVFTSAAMGGYGVLIVFGSVWVVPTAILASIACWNHFRGQASGHTPYAMIEEHGD